MWQGYARNMLDASPARPGSVMSLWLTSCALAGQAVRSELGRRFDHHLAGGPGSGSVGRTLYPRAMHRDHGNENFLWATRGDGGRGRCWWAQRCLVATASAWNASITLCRCSCIAASAAAASLAVTAATIASCCGSETAAGRDQCQRELVPHGLVAELLEQPGRGLVRGDVPDGRVQAAVEIPVAQQL